MRQKKKRKSFIKVFAKVLIVILAFGFCGLFLISYLNNKAASKGDLVTAITADKGIFAGIMGEGYERDEPSPVGPIEVEAAESQSQSKYSAILNNPEYMHVNKIYPKEAAEVNLIRIGFAGDILFDRSYSVMSSMLSAGGNIERMFSPELLDKMRGLDIMIVNNEFPYSRRGTPIPGKTYTFRADPDYVRYLGEMGVDGVTLANNHAFDYGADALEDTFTTLEGVQMPYAGAGRNIDEASKAMTFLVNDRLVSILCASQIERQDNPNTRGATADRSGVFRCLDATKLCEQISLYKQTSDVVIVFVHWGTESTAVLDWRQIEQAREFEAAGADVVIGAHPHVLQPAGFVNDMPVAYSLGNFVFSSKLLDGALAEVVIDLTGKTSNDLVSRSDIKVQIHPTQQNNMKGLLLQGEQRMRVINYINSVSEYSVLDENGIMRQR